MTPSKEEKTKEEKAKEERKRKRRAGVFTSDF
jgi:hypothetical protein